MTARNLRAIGIFIAALIILHFCLPADAVTNPFIVTLIHGKQTWREFPSSKKPPRAIVLFASGDGGWSYCEEEVSATLQNEGCEVIGIDCHAYASQDYDLNTLQADYTTVALQARAEFPIHPPPIILGGYSMGAAQAIAAGGGPNPPPGLVGLLLMDPLSRGRYGLHFQDRLNILPTGDGTFSTDEFASKFKNVRIVQWHAVNDTIDSRDWLKNLRVPYREYDLIGADHGYVNNFHSFLKRLGPSLEWILGLEKKGAVND